MAEPKGGQRKYIKAHKKSNGEKPLPLNIDTSKKRPTGRKKPVNPKAVRGKSVNTSRGDTTAEKQAKLDARMPMIRAVWQNRQNKKNQSK